MTERSSGYGRDDWSRDGYVPGEQYADERYYGSDASRSARPGAPGPGMPSGYGSSDRDDPGYGSYGQGGSGYGSSSGQGGSGYGSSGQGGSGYGQGGPDYGQSGQGAVRPGAPGAGMPTSPIWQPAPGQGGQGRAAPGEAGTGLGTPPPEAQPEDRPAMDPLAVGAPGMGGPATGGSRAADSKGFFEALFDFSFTSFVTVKIIRVLYVLILVMAALSAFGYTILAFTASPLFGFLVLVIGDPLFIIIVMAFWRLVLEAFVVVFRIAEDVRSLREHADR